MLNAKMGEQGELGSLAMLDEFGTVVCWYGRDNDDDSFAATVLGKSVEQFYAAQDIAIGLPTVDLRSARSHRSSTQAGWRLRADGEEYWAMTLIESIVHRSGRLEGFAHVIRRSSGPWENLHAKRATLPALAQEVRPVSELVPSRRPTTAARDATRLRIGLSVCGLLAMLLGVASSAAHARNTVLPTCFGEVPDLSKLTPASLHCNRRRE